MSKIPTLFLLSYMVFSMSCADVPETKIDFTSPQNGQIYSLGESIDFVGSIASATGEDLHGYEIHIKNKADQSEVFSTEGHVHGATVDVSESWVITVANADLEIQIISQNNHEGGISTKKVNVRVN